MNGVQKRLARLKALRTELQGLGLEGAAEEVAEEIASMEAMPTRNPAVAAYLGAVLELEKDMSKIESRGGRVWD